MVVHIFDFSLRSTIVLSSFSVVGETVCVSIVVSLIRVYIPTSCINLTLVSKAVCLNNSCFADHKDEIDNNKPCSNVVVDVIFQLCSLFVLVHSSGNYYLVATL